MQNSYLQKVHAGLLFTIFILALVTGLVLIPSQFSSEAGAKKGEGLFPRTTSQEDGLDFYDIRMNESKDGQEEEALARFRQASGKDASFIADQREQYVRGEESLRTRVPTLKVDYNLDLRIPEVIAPDVNRGRLFLTPSSSVKRSEILRNFIKQNNDLVGMSDHQIDNLEVQADYTNPDGNLSFAILEQTINGIPVSRGEVKAGFTKKGEIIRVINNVAPGLDYGSLSTDFDDPANAVRNAARHINHEVRSWETTVNSARSTDLKVTFGTELYATTAEKLYFPTEPGIAVPAWRVTIWKDVPAYEITVDAETGTLLRRENIVKDQTQPVTYNVWANTNSSLSAHDSPAPLTPGPIDPALGTQGTNVARTMVTRIGNEAPYTFNNNGWITDGANTTSGNNVHAGLDRGSPNGVDAPSTGSGMRVFDFAANPPPGDPAPGDNPLPAGEVITPCPASPNATINPSQHAAVTQMFYVVNRLHDETYQRGFTEQARNFQVDNFGRGGVGVDPIQAEGQDCSGSNNANMASSSTDGSIGRMQMYLWTPPTPDRDGTLDAEIVVHEIGHGIMNRLHTLGTAGTQGGQMHEGTGDFLAHLLLSQATDPINGTYTTGGYSTLNLRAGAPFSNLGNYYYGIRRFPKAVIAFTGGPMNRPHNPLTYGDIDPAQINVTDGAFAAAFPGSATAVHDGGEIWSSMLWEVRSILVARLGHAAGTAKMLQLQLDGMKLVGATPTMLSERNAIIAGANAGPDPANDAADVREGFRRRGLGFSATNPSGNTVVEAFDSPELTASSPTVTSGNNLLEPNECNTLNIPMTNLSVNAATNITAVLSSSTPGITVTQPNSAYPDMPAGAGPINNTTPFQVSVDNTVACFTSAQFTLTFTFTGGGGGSPETFNFSLPVGLAGTDYMFSTGTGGTIPEGGVLVAGSQADDAAVTVPLPAGWNSSIYGVPVTSLSASTNGMVTANGAASTAFTNTTLRAAVGGTNPTLFPAWDDYDMDPGDTTGGGIYVNTVGSAPNRELYIEWRATHFAEVPTTISNNFAVKLTEGSNTVQYIHVLTGVAPNIDGASATVGIQRSAGAGSPFTLVGFNTPGSITPGMVRTGTLPGGQCTPGTGTCGVLSVRSRADFDGDGRTDLSVFRPSEGNWYLNRSTAGFSVIKWGVSGDTLVPGDFDGDNKTDTAVFRPNADSSQPDFFILNSNGFTVSGVSWGVSGDIPMNGDYDGDGKTDIAVYRPSTQVWYILNSNGGTTTANFGTTGDIPLVINHDTDARDNLAVFRPGNNTWYIARATGVPATNFDSVPFGQAGDLLVPADYVGDEKIDIAVFRPGVGTWFIRDSNTGAVSTINFGTSGDIPVPGDYDGDGKDDAAIYRSGQWWVNQSSGGVITQNFGIGSDTAIPRRYIP